MTLVLRGAETTSGRNLTQVPNQHCSVFGAGNLCSPAPWWCPRARSSGGQSAALIRPRPLVRVQARPPRVTGAGNPLAGDPCEQHPTHHLHLDNMMRGIAKILRPRTIAFRRARPCAICSRINISERTRRQLLPSARSTKTFNKAENSHDAAPARSRCGHDQRRRARHGPPRHGATGAHGLSGASRSGVWIRNAYSDEVMAAKKGAWWMPWRRRPKKDAATRRNAPGRRWQPENRRNPNGATRPA